MADYISREAVFQVVHGIARGIADRDTEALKAKDMKAFYMAKGAKEILKSVDTNLCYVPVADVHPVNQWINVNVQLPKELETVIVYEKDYGVMWGDYQGIKYSQPVWIVRKSGLIIRTTEVTHWRHLPKPPVNN